MYIDYLTLLLVNMTAGLVMLAAWVCLDSNAPAQKRWVTGFLMTGTVASLMGLHLVLTWPLPGAFNIVFGEMSIFYGTLMLGLAFAVGLGFDLLPVAVYATLVGIAALLLGAQVINLGLTKEPLLAGIAFMWMGIIGLFSLPMLRMRASPLFRRVGGVGLLIAALLWAVTGYPSYWNHVQGFAKWKPADLKYEMDMNPAPPPAAAPAK